ncbi:MAG: hypothetical protein DLM52_06575 [Chthoniobacterales bacterium]|nr:MAG: hypothetical protein DLM52_06575 [Chthoniobacterales bacterium]
MQADVNHAPAAYETAIRLEFSDGSAPLTKLDEVNLALARYGALLWPIDLSAAPQSIGKLLAQETLTPAESAQVRDHFLLSRERLLQLIAEAGRKPQVPGGSELNTSDTTNNVTYPQLYTVAAGFDYSRFDKFHVNGAPHGPGIDEILQLLTGANLRILLQIRNEGLVTLRVSCNDSTGWIITYDGGHPHIGSLTSATPGTKLLVQSYRTAEMGS